ncbi:MAG TPA: type II secretion system protein GspL [Pseudomonadales bacterium]
MPRLFIRLLSPAAATEEGYSVTSAWMIQEDDGRTRARGETDFRGLSDLIDPHTDWVQNPNNIVVTIPAEHVLSLSVEVPGRSVGQIRRALPFVVEEYITTDIEAMHLAPGELRRGAPSRVNLLEISLLEAWLACLAELGVHPGYLFSEAELLPVAPRQATLLLDGDRVLVRTPDQAAAVDRDNLVLAVEALDVDRVLVVFGALTDIEQGQLAQDREIETVQTPGATTVLEYVAAHWQSADAVNLLQGPYRPRQPSNPNWQRWRAVAALAGVWIVVALLTRTAEAIYADHQADRLEAESVALYRDIFPNERRVINPRRQLQAKLGEGTDGGSDLLGLLGPLAATLGQDTRINSFSYDQDRGELSADLYIDAYETLDRVKEGLSQAGVPLEVITAEQQQNSKSVRARVRLGGRRADA